MKTFTAVLKIRAECISDAEELLNDYTGEETDLKILEIQAPRKIEDIDAELRNIQGEIDDLFEQRSELNKELEEAQGDE